MRVFSVSWIFFFLPLFLPGQNNNIGAPFIQNYSKKTYGGGTQNWGFAQDKRGVVFVANNEGMLEFNGQEWQIHPLPNRTIARSIAMDGDGRIFIGGQDEVGYFFSDPDGFLRFRSLKDRIPEGAGRFEDVWDILSVPEGVFFRASDNIYRYWNDTVTVFSNGHPLTFLGGRSGNVFIQDAEQGLLKFNGETFAEVPDGGKFRGIGITEFLAYHPDTVLFITEKNGIFYHTKNSSGQWIIRNQDFLYQKLIQAAALLPGRQIALATGLGGLLIIDKDRKARHWLIKEDGLQNNNIRSIFADRDKNLWLGLDNGLDYVVASSPFSILIPDGAMEGTAYTARIHADKIYFGTSNGLFYADWKSYYDPFYKKDRFRMIPGTSGQVWGLSEVYGELLLGHHEGAFLVEDNGIQRISPEMGYWMFLPLKDNPQVSAGGNYYGLSLYQRKEPGKWEFLEKIPGLNESCRIMARSSEGAVWISHPYRGVYRIQSDPGQDRREVKFFGEAQGLPSDLQNYVFSINGETVVCARQGIYRFNPEDNRFYPHEIYNGLLGESSQVRRLVEDKQGNVWYVMEGEVGVLRVTDKGLHKEVNRHVFPELKDKLVGGFEYVYPYDENNVFFGAEKGVIHFNPQVADQAPQKIRPVISKVFCTVNTDSLIFGGNYLENSGINTVRVFPNRLNAFRFHFATPQYEELKTPEYQYMLEGSDKGWSDWTEKTEREYTNLPAGKYSFTVRSRIPGGSAGETSVYSFEILPPWYAGRWAYLTYSALAIGFLLSLVMIPQRKFQKEREQLRRERQRQEEAHREAVKQSEKEIMRLRNEKLEAEVHHKNNELASATMHLLQKNELLAKIGDELRKVNQNTEEKATKKEIRKLIHLLQDDAQLDSDWELFSYHFDQVHNDFFKRLREKYPGLTPKDHKLCAYLRLNLTTKEIAPLMNISVRGVEISRYRLRRKLGLDNEDNLTRFLMSF
jgi:DNA-binding CsgD family transcriptional regulator